MWETWVQSLGWEDPLEKGTATYSSILAWRIPWKEEPGGLQYIGRKELGTTKVTKQAHTCAQVKFFTGSSIKYNQIAYAAATAKSLQSCPTLCDPSRGFSQPRDLTCVSYISCTGREFLYH